MGHWAGHLVFVRWSKIQALFLPTPSKDKNIDVCICTGRLLGDQKGRESHDIICVDMHHGCVVGLCGRVHLRKKLHMHFGEGPWTSQV